jgi:hypothetical protein
MGDRQRSRHTNEIEDIQFILTCGITKGQMRDEIYVQVCKQLQDNPNGESIRKGWEILCILTVTFPPSKNLESYLTEFVNQNHHLQENHVDVFSHHVSNKLKRICVRGAKGKVLTSAEIKRAKEAPFKPSVFGESIPFTMELQQKLDPALQIPQIVPFLANTVRETNGQCSEGIFRVPGDADAVTDLVSFFYHPLLDIDLLFSVYELKTVFMMHRVSQTLTSLHLCSSIGYETLQNPSSAQKIIRAVSIMQKIPKKPSKSSMDYQIQTEELHSTQSASYR